jgi:hypothetical protein
MNQLSWQRSTSPTRRDPDALEMMTVSDGATEVVLYPSPLGGMSVLLAAIGALVQLIPCGDEHIYRWEGDQAYIRWRSLLDSDALRIQVYVWREPVYAATCAVWQFAATLRLCASRLAVTLDRQRPHGGDWIRNCASCQQVDALLDDRKST